MSFPRHLDRLAFWLTLVMLALLPFHAFFYTWIKSYFWTDTWTILLHVWKELIILLLGLLGLSKLLCGHASLPRGRGNAFVFFYLGLTLLHLALFPNDSIFQAVFGLRTAAAFVVLFLILQLFSWAQKNYRALLATVLIVGSISAFFGILQATILPADFLTHFGYSQVVSTWDPQGNLPAYHQLGDDPTTIRAQSTFSQPNRFAAYLLLLIFPLGFLAQHAATKRRRHLAGLTAIITLVALFFTYSRGAWLSFFIAALFLGWHQLYPFLSKRVLGSLLALVAMGGLILALALPYNPTLQEALWRGGSTLAHFQKSVTALQIGLNHPFGLGLGQAGGVSMRFDPAGFGLGTENFYLQTLVEQGYLGFLALVVFLIYLAYHLLRQPARNYYLGYSFLALLIANLFTEVFDDSAVVLTTFALLAVAWQIQYQPLPARQS